MSTVTPLVVRMRAVTIRATLSATLIALALIAILLGSLVGPPGWLQP
jgi:hypothetical protein